jgi:hypothetical protein
MRIATRREGTLLTPGRAMKLSTGQTHTEGTLLTPNWDSADATRSYPEDSTDEANSQEQITFE